VTRGAGLTVAGVPLSFDTTVRYPGLKLDVVGVSPELMLRWPLFATPEIPAGRLQPYLTVGPTFFIAHMKDTSNFAPPSPQTDTDTSLGLKLGGGVAWQFHKHVAIFSEYRFTSFEPTFACHHNLPGLPHRDRVRMDLDTHHFTTGISIRF
jgi:opacity protein-like surface antigen